MYQVLNIAKLALFEQRPSEELRKSHIITNHIMTDRLIDRQADR